MFRGYEKKKKVISCFNANEKFSNQNTDVLRWVEQEQEHISNILLKKLTQLTQEKVELEIKLEQEEEFIVNRLHRFLLYFSFFFVYLYFLSQTSSCCLSGKRKSQRKSCSISIQMC